MDNKTIYFINGMPRSGSTLLCNILAQNPRVHTTPTSGLGDLLSSTHMYWNRNPIMRASENWGREKMVLQQIMQAWHADTDRPIIFNKSRSWMGNIELLQNILEHPVKIITTTRPITNILSSFEKLHRKEMNTMDSPQETGPAMRTLEGRLGLWTSENGVVGGTFNSIRDAIMRGHRDKIHFVDFDRLTSQPASTLAGVYKFIGEPYYNHDFSNVAQYTKENDREHGYTDLHTIRQSIEPVPDDSREILGPAWEQYRNFNYDF